MKNGLSLSFHKSPLGRRVHGIFILYLLKIVFHFTLKRGVRRREEVCISLSVIEVRFDAT